MTTVRSISARSARRKPRLRVNSPKQANHHTDDGYPRKPAIMGTGGRPYRRAEVRPFGQSVSRPRVLARVEEHRPSADADALRADTGGAYT